MELNRAARCLEKLGNPTRLAIFRLLVRGGPEGLPVGEVQEQLGIPASTLSHHLAQPAVRRHTPKAGARCVRSARRDLCGGRGVTRVPTAIVIRGLVLRPILRDARSAGSSEPVKLLEFWRRWKGAQSCRL